MARPPDQGYPPTAQKEIAVQAMGQFI